MRIRITLLTLLLFSVLFTGCGRRNDNNGDPTNAPTKAPTTAVTQAPAPTTAVTQAPGNTTTSPAPTGTDVVTTASIVNTEEAFLKAISNEGTWIICLLNDLKTDKDLVLEGEFKNGKKDDAGNDVVQRKIALYSQNDNREVTARYTLTAPKITIRSPKASMQKGIFVGDVIVEVDGFELVDQEIQGNVYFTKQEYMDSFIMDDTSKITGKKELQKK